jgi:Phage endonuclease I
VKYKRRADGYRSGYEATVARNLTRGGIRFAYEPDKLPVWVPVTAHECKACHSRDIYRKTTYTPDFRLAAHTYLETKGKFTARNRTMLLAYRDQYRGHKFHILFQRNNRLAKKSATRYTDWCEKHNITCAVGETPPRAWLK